MPKTSLHKPLEIKISTVVAVAALLRGTDLAVLDAALREMTGGESDYFDNEFTIIDVGGLEQQDAFLDWSALVALFRSHRLAPIAVRNAPEAMHAAILEQGLTIDTMPAPRAAPQPEPVAVPVAVEVPAPAAQPAPSGAAPAAASLPVMIVDTPVRAGQRIYAKGCDLVITAAVNNGAEIIADGSIHVYAPLRGRALAGASGNANARIFAMAMEAELVSIAGLYRTFEDGLPKEISGKPAQAQLKEDRLDISLLRNLGR